MRLKLVLQAKHFSVIIVISYSVDDFLAENLGTTYFENWPFCWQWSKLASMSGKYVVGRVIEVWKSDL